MNTLKNYSTLISNLPVLEQCFITKRESWKKAENKFPWFKILNDELFKDLDTLQISRKDIFNTKDSIKNKIILAIFWGYPRGMRGNHFIEILFNMEKLEKLIFSLQNLEFANDSDFSKIINEFANIPGLGISTYSKLLYFFKISFNNNPCVILDQRLIDVFQKSEFVEFESLKNIKRYNCESKYLNYLKLMSSTSIKLNTRCENLEQFLFIFGNNLKV